MKKIATKFHLLASNFLTYGRRLWKWTRWRYYVGANLGLAVLGSHMLISYRQPVYSLELLHYRRYWLWLALGIVALSLLQYFCRWLVYRAMGMRYREELKRWGAVFRFVLIGLTVGLALPFTIVQVASFVFHGMGLSIQKSGYLEHEFVWLCHGIYYYTLVVLIGWQQRRLYKGNMLLRARLRRNRSLEDKMVTVLFDWDLEQVFMVIRKKSGGYLLTRSGRCRKDSRRLSEIEAMLDFGFVEISRGVYIRHDCILGWDEGAGEVYLEDKVKEVFYFLLEKDPQLRGWHEEVSSPTGLLTLRKSFHSEIRKKCANLLVR